MATINENTQKLLEERYFLRDTKNGELLENTAEQMFKRVASFVAKAEKTPELQKKYEKEFFSLMNNQLAMPNTPTLINAGYKKCLSACSVIGKIPDNLEGIYEYMWKNAKLTKMGCGVGQDLSDIRPKGEIIKSSGGKSAGVVNWMHLINSVASTTIQGDKARRAANMVSLRFNHPDILDFIRSKQTDGSLSSMNISVTITDDEMNKIKNDKNVNLTWNNKIYKTIKARDIFNEIIDGLYFNGEPGLLFLDSVNANNPFNLQDGSFDSDNAHYMDTTNPCLHKDTYMVTENGLEKISELSSKIWNGEVYTPSSSWKTGIKKVYKVMTNSGFEYTTTKDHKFLLNDNSWCEAIDLIGKKLKFEIKEKDWIGVNPHEDINYEILGFEFGDGTYHKASKRMKYIYATPTKDQEVIDIIEKEFNDTFKPKEKNKPNSNHIINIPFGTFYANAFFDKIEDRMIPDWVLKLPKKEMKEFLRGLFSANGCNLKKYHKIQLVSINSDTLKQVQQMLLMFGIKGKLWYHNKKHDVEFTNGTYTCKQSAHIVISRNSYKKFLDDIGFIQEYKNGYEDFNSKPEDNYETAILISELDEVEVWDFSEPKLHMGVSNGIYLHNCGEQPLESFEFCNLMSMNVENMYDEKTNDVYWELFKSTIEKSIRFLDDVIDVNEYVLPEFKVKVLNNRKIGLGVAGYANLLIKLGIKYDSKEALDFIDKLFGFKKQIEENYNTELAKEKGNFPNWKDSIYGKMNIPARCSTISTQAPTGSVSSILNTTAYGIEPLFSVVYLRRIVTGDIYESSDLFKKMLHEMINNNDKEQKILKECYDKGTTQIKVVPKKLQDLFRCANDISPEWHIKIQAAMQKFYHNAISKTINAPEDATQEELFNLLINGWNLGIKGVTYYRNNSRKNQTIQIGQSINNNRKLDSIEPIKRSSMGKTHGVTLDKKSACGKLYITINRDNNGNIVESFVNVGKSGICKSNIDGINRMISLALRSGVKTEEIIDQLSGIVCPSCVRTKTKKERVDGASCPDIISKVLKEEYTEQTIDKSEIQNECPDCGIELHMSEGCMTCSCGYSKCS